MAGKNIMNKLPPREKQERRSINVSKKTYERYSARGEYGNSFDLIMNFVMDRLETYEKNDKSLAKIK